MKKKKKLILIIMITIGITLLVTGSGMILVTALTSTKTALTSEEFKEKAKVHNLEVEDVEITGQNGEKNSDIQEATYATSKNGWVIEYYIVKDEDTAKSLYLETKKIFKTYQNDMSEEKNETKKNYDYYTLKTQTSYFHVCRVDNTILSINAKDDDEKQIIEIIKKLGY